MKTKIFIALLALILLATSLLSCSEYVKSSEHNTGVILDADFFESVSISLADKETEKNKTEAVDLPDGAYLGMPVIWCDGNDFWHTYQKCPYFSFSAPNGSGTLSDAIAAGKVRICPYCYKVDFNNSDVGDNLYDIP